MKRIFTLFLLLTFLFTAFSQQSNCPPTVTHNGVTYQTIWMGGNCWMKENLRSTQFGTQSNVTELYPGLTPTYMVYPGAPLSMGYLYTWYSAVGLPEGSLDTPPTAISERVQGICPNEWAIPSAAQLQALINAGETRAGVQSYWTFNNGFIPAGPYNFSMVPSGFYNARFGQFAELNHVGYIWTLNYNGATSTCGIFPFDCRPTATMNMNKNSLLSVRCVKAPPYGVEEMTVCDSVTWNGRTLYTTGRYVANLPNDSVSTLLLTVNYTTYATANVTACDSYTWDVNGKTYTTSGTHMGVIKNHKNCDSIVTLNLTINYQNTGIDIQNHCDSYTWIDGNTYTESTNTPTFVLTNQYGCDSVVTLNLTIRKMTTGIDVQNHCDSYTWIDGITYTESTNEPTFTLTNSVGCDSVVTLNLTIRKKTYGIDVQDHCDSYTWMNDVTYTESTNEPVFTITNEAGCDSIVTLDLTIRKSTSSPSQSYEAINTYTWNGVTYTTSGVYTATLTNAVGCDSTATLDLTVLYQFPITYNVNDGVMPVEYPIDYIQGIGATLPIPTKLNNRFDGWYDNPDFTGSPITAISNSASGNKQFWALWTILEKAQNYSLSFGGSSSYYVRVANAPELNPTEAITLEAWIYPTTWYTNAPIIAKDGYSNTGYILRTGSDGQLKFKFGNSTSSFEITTVSPHPLTLNEWQHVAATYDGTTMKLFRNGIEIATQAQTGTISSTTFRLEIGRSYNSYNYFKGNIDEVRLFDVAVDAATIQTWYNKSLNNTHDNYSDLIGYYEFDNTSDPLTLTATEGTDGIVNGATYATICSTPFITSSSQIEAASSVTVSHPTAEVVLPGSENAIILKIEIETTIDASATQINLNTNGTTDISDISNATLWYTGSSNIFDMNTSFGSVIANPNGTLTFTGDQPLTCGKNYFWLTYDIVPTATINNVVDAALVDATVERLTITPVNGAPNGSRRIADACLHTLQIRDEYGDGWNGGYINMYVNNNLIFSDLTISSGGLTWTNYPFYAETGDTIRVIRTVDGNWPTEMFVQILGGNDGPVILAETEPTAAPGVFTIGGCYVQINSSADENGTITPAGVVPVLKNGNQTFTITPNLNYFIDEVLINGINNPAAVAAGTYTFTNVTEPQTIHVIFNTNYVTPTLVTPPTTTSGGQGDLLSTLPLTGGLVQHNDVDVPGTFAWTNPTTPLTAPGNYSVTFTPNDLSTYFPITFDIFVNVSITSLTVADGTTTNSYIPFEGLYLDANQHNQIIYPSSMLTPMLGRQISSITFYLSSPPSAPWTSQSTWKIGTTTTNTLSGFITVPSTIVYTGLMPVVSNSVTITFTEPFIYSGDNLIIDFSNIAANWKSASFYGISQTGASYYGRTSTVNNFLPKIKFELVP